MFENTKSVYFIKTVLSFLDDQRKFELVKYNKNLQKLIGINLMDYKRFSRKYIIYVTKVYGKEYDGFYDNLIFEGEYLNGKRNGKGKEYDNNGKLRFEGEYLNGKKWNGKGYDNHNNISYEIKNGNGFVKEYNYFTDTIFEGEYLNGEKNGIGKEYSYFHQLKFEGFLKEKNPI